MIVVEVNECRFFTTVGPSGWWVRYRSRRSDIRVVDVAINGHLVHVPCEDREDADRLIEDCLAAGVPRDALRVREVAA